MDDDDHYYTPAYTIVSFVPFLLAGILHRRVMKASLTFEVMIFESQIIVQYLFCQKK